MKRIAVLLTFAALTFTVHGDDAAALYTAKCKMCHGANGAGDTPMGKKLALKALGSAEVQKKNDADLVKVIAKGSGKMPAFESKVPAEQIKQLVAVIRGFAKK